jgi:hypothetical protein
LCQSKAVHRARHLYVTQNKVNHMIGLQYLDGFVRIDGLNNEVAALPQVPGDIHPARGDTLKHASVLRLSNF